MKRILATIALTSTMFSTTTIAAETFNESDWEVRQPVYLFSQFHLKSMCSELLDSYNGKDFDARRKVKNICFQEFLKDVDVGEDSFKLKIPTTKTAQICKNIEERALEEIHLFKPDEAEIEAACYSKIADTFELRVSMYKKSTPENQEKLINQ